MYFVDCVKRDIVPNVSSKPSGDRILYLDILKAFSAFLVVFYHYSFNSLDYGFQAGSPYCPNLNRIVMSIASCSVPLFFFINGALMLSKQRSWQSVYYKAAKTLSLIVILRFLEFPSWFFRTLIILYLLYPMLSYLWSQKRKLYALLVAAVLIFPFAYNEFVVVSKLFSINSLQITGAGTMYCLVYFCLGNILIRKRSLSLVNSVLISLSGLLLLLFDCIVLTSASQTMADGVNGAFPTLGALLLTIGVFEAARGLPFTKLHPVLRFFSEGILSIYLFHLAICRLFWSVLGFPANLISALFGALIICSICCTIGAVFKRIPVICFLTKL